MASKTAGTALRRALHSSSRSKATPNSSITRGRIEAQRNAAVSPDASTSAVKLTASSSGTSRAVDVSYLPVLAKAEVRKDAIGTPMIFSERYAASILDNAIPRTTRKDLAYTTQPSTVLRQATHEIVETLKSQPSLRAVLSGTSGSGRTTTMLQTIAYCEDQGWLILHVPDAYALIDGRHSYSAPTGEGMPYGQDESAQAILKRFLAVNAKNALKKLDSQILKTIEQGSKNRSAASEALKALLASPSKEAPLLVAIDGAEALSLASQYLDKEGRRIHANKLEVPRMLSGYLGGDLQGGMHILVAGDKTSAAPAVANATDYDLSQLSREEAAGIYQHLYDTKLLNGEISDSTFLENLVASNGNARVFTRGLRAIPGGTARGVVKNGKSRGTSVRDDRLITITL